MSRSPTLLATLVLGAVLLVGGCAEGGRTEYVEPDSGSGIGGSTYDQSTARMVGPDSTLGTGGRTGERGVAGDTLGARGTPAQSQPRDTTPP